jgi:hypothetical protein
MYGQSSTPSRSKNVSLLHRVQTGSTAHQPHIQWKPDALPSSVQRPRSEADHSPASSVKVHNAGAMPQLTTTHLGMVLILSLSCHSSGGQPQASHNAGPGSVPRQPLSTLVSHVNYHTNVPWMCHPRLVQLAHL